MLGAAGKRGVGERVSRTRTGREAPTLGVPGAATMSVGASHSHRARGRRGTKGVLQGRIGNVNVSPSFASPPVTRDFGFSRESGAQTTGRPSIAGIEPA